MTDGGWIPAWRKVFDADHWLAPTKRHPAGRREAWLDLCQMATHKPRKVRGERIERGELVASVRTLAERWAWSRSATERFLQALKDEKMLQARVIAHCTRIGTPSGTPAYTVYAIAKYDTYAVVSETDRDTLRDASGTPPGQEQEQNHSTKEHSSFDEVWAVCRRGPKRQALHHYRKAVPSKVSHESLLAAWKAHVESAREPQYVAHLFRWIRDERWEESPPPAKNGTSGALERPSLTQRAP